MARKSTKKAKAIRLADTEIRAKNAPPIAPETGEKGVDGVAIYSGRIYAESNPRLRWESAFGTPGTTTWGEWERLHRTDHAVSSALNMLVAPLRDADVVVEPAEEDDEESQKIADVVRDNLLEWLDPRWPTLLEQMVTYGLGYGFTLHEEVWASREDGRVPGGVAWYVKKLAQRLPSSVENDGWKEEEGELATIVQSGTRNGQWQSKVELPASKCLLGTWNRNGNNYSGFSAFRPVWYLAQMRADLLRILAIGHAREALGVPVASADADAVLTTEQLDELQEIVENLTAHEKAGVVLPKGAKLEFLTSPASNKSSVLETWRALGIAIHETVQTQQIALGTGETGSRSVGEVHDATKNAFIAGIRAWLEAILNGVGSQCYTGLVRKIVDANFGPQKKYPKLKLVAPDTDMPVGEFATALKTLADAGALILTESDENGIRERLGLEQFNPEERAAEMERKKAAAAAFQNSFPKEKESGEGDEKPSKFPGEEINPGEEKAEKKLSDFALRPAEQVLALADITNFLDSGRDRFEMLAKPIVEDMVRGALADVQEAMKDSDPGELKSLKLDAKLLSKAIEVFVENARAFGYRQARLETIRGGRPVKMADEPEALDDDEVEKMVQAQTKLITERIQGRLKQQIWDEAINAVRTGKNADSAVDSVLRQLEDAKTLRSDAGIVLGRSFSMGREQYISEDADNISHLEFSCALETSSCSKCREADGLTFKVGSAEHLTHVPPLATCDGKMNCRCVLVPVYRRN